jgi:hypothetical protein
VEGGFEPADGSWLTPEAYVGSARVDVAILGGDPITSRSLEALLQAAGYYARSLGEDQVDDLGEVLTLSRVLIVAPAPSSGFREVLLRALFEETQAEVPVVELLPVDGKLRFRGAHVLDWPCSPEKLEQTVAAALRARP